MEPYKALLRTHSCSMGADDFSVSSLFSNDLWILQAFETALLFFLFLYAIYYAAIRIDTEAYQLPFSQEITQAL